MIDDIKITSLFAFTLEPEAPPAKKVKTKQSCNLSQLALNQQQALERHLEESKRESAQLVHRLTGTEKENEAQRKLVFLINRPLIFILFKTR